MPRERELKLEIQSASLPRVEQWLQANRAKRTAARAMISIYFDTPDFALRRAGVALRVRKSGWVYTQTIKLSGAQTAGLFDRDEWESSVSGFEPDLTQARKTGLKLFRSKNICAGLGPVFEVTTRRADFVLANEQDIAFSIDRGSIITDAGRTRFCEIEIETRDGSLHSVFEIARSLARLAPVSVGTAAKSDRGYRLLEPAEDEVFRARDPLLARDMTAGEAFRITGRECLRQIAANVPETIAGTAESLHQLRVGLRRLRAAISLFSRIVGRGETQHVKTELQWASRCLGPARDLDVLLENGIDAPPAAFGNLQTQRRRAYSVVRKALRSPRFQNLLLTLVEWIECGPHINAEQPVAIHAASELGRRHKKLVKQLSGLADLNAAERHRLRIRAKRLRYGVEFFRQLFAGQKSARRRHELLSGLKALQQELGMLNDIETQQRVSADLGIAPPPKQHLPETLVQRRLDAAVAAARQIAKAKPFWDSSLKARRSSQ